jgi:putative transcriptional regulator
MTPVRIRILEQRLAAGLSQEQLAEMVGMAQADISRIETGKTSAISLDVLDRLCKALKCEPGDILVRKRR